MGAHQLAIQIQVAKSSKSQPYLALSHSAIHLGREPSALLTLFSVPLHLTPQTVFTSLHRTGALRTARLLASCASPRLPVVPRKAPKPSIKGMAATIRASYVRFR